MQVTDAMVAKAAESAYLRNRAGDTPWDALSPQHQSEWREKVRPVVTAALAEMWRPIEEYDEASGERVILGIERNGTIDEVHVGYFSWAVNDDEESLWWSEQADNEICPTHFMPLPTPPRRGVRMVTALIPWHGGECPEHPDSQIYPEYRGPVDPTKGVRITCAPASRLDWSHDGGPDDIIAYRVSYDARRPSPEVDR